MEDTVQQLYERARCPKDQNSAEQDVFESERKANLIEIDEVDDKDYDWPVKSARGELR